MLRRTDRDRPSSLPVYADDDKIRPRKRALPWPLVAIVVIGIVGFLGLFFGVVLPLGSDDSIRGRQTEMKKNWVKKEQKGSSRN
jgi:hypothetical protein